MDENVRLFLIRLESIQKDIDDLKNDMRLYFCCNNKEIEFESLVDDEK